MVLKEEIEMLIIRCCKCGASIGKKEDFKDGVRESHTYCDLCLKESVKEVNTLTSKKGNNKIMAKYLVTGGAGFIGSNLVERLLEKGNSVRVIDNLSTGKIENIMPFLNDIEFIYGDIRNQAEAMDAAAGVDYVLHQAAIPSVQRSIDNPLESEESNIKGTLNILMAAREAGVKRLVYAASSSYYGNSNQLPKREDMPPDTLSPYALTKYVGESYCRLFHALYGLETVAIRYFNVFGPKQDPSSPYSGVISKFITSMMNGKPIVIYGDGEHSRDFTYIENIIDLNLRACTAPGVAGQVFNGGCGKRIPLNELVSAICRAMDKNVMPIYADERAGDVKHSLADVTKAEKLLGYKPLIGLEEGLLRTIAWYLKSSQSPEVGLGGEAQQQGAHNS